MKPFYWTKRIGPRHISGNGIPGADADHGTLCGKPMLGNNYSYRNVAGDAVRLDAEPCAECEKRWDELTSHLPDVGKSTCEHEADLDSLGIPMHDYPPVVENGVLCAVIDVNCKHCGRSGSFKVEVELPDINW